jgi:CRP/FNR family transcriptional regulator, cyclic AMP receptor protein
MDSLNIRFRSAGLEPHILSLQERATLLEKSKLGSGLVWQELQTLAGYLSAWKAKSGTYLCRQGDQSDFVCMIFQGRVSIVKEDLHKDAKEIASVGPGQTVGEMALIDREPRSASTLVKSPVLLLVLDEEGFNRMEEDVPRLWGKVLLQMARILSKRLRQTSGVLAEYISD